jgi:glutamate-ammonia-ligase adenylyltransferase
MEKKMEHSLEVKSLGNREYRVAVSLPDFVGLLSVVTGLFSSYGLNIERGKIETVENQAIDVFEVTARKAPDWEQFEKDLDFLTEKARAGQREEVRSEIHSRIIRYLRAHKEVYSDHLYPMDLHIDQETSPLETVVDIKSQDTVAFLYELTNALAILGINIVRMEIRTVEGKVQDRLWLTHEGEKILSEEKLRALQWAILLIKQFTHLLPKVADPLSALEQFASFGKDIFSRSDFSDILLAFKNPEILENLSAVLGTSRFLWEEFIRFQYEAIIPIIERPELLKKKKTRMEMQRELDLLFETKPTFAEKADALNQYKDREMFRIDLRHLVGKASYIGEFSEEFTHLVETVVETACRLAWEETAKRFPPPMISNGQKSEAAIFGLGKFGGEELGYASDVEVLFVYSDAEDTTSPQSQQNLIFYTEVVRQFLQIIRARSEGVFEIDLRLRPYGKDGPLAASFGLFKKYYSQEGEAWNFERQALVKLRYVSGSERLGREVERLRDDFVYSDKPFDFKEAVRLRKRQQKELVKKGTVNAKYSAGGLLDVEYLIQTLQIAYGCGRAGDIRSPNTLKALRALWQEGVMNETQFQILRADYLFLRNLINALRIVRGNARDLTFPEEDAEEFAMLARRMGYQGDDPGVRKQFRQDCHHHMTQAAKLYETWVAGLAGSDWTSLAASAITTPAALRVSLDDLLRGEISTEERTILHTLGFREIPELIQCLQRICPKAPAFEAFAQVMDRAWPVWKTVGDPDLAVKNLEYFIDAAQDRESLWQTLADARKGLPMLLHLFGQSRYLSEVFIQNPDLWKWIRSQEEISLEHTQRLLVQEKQKPWTFDDLKSLRHVETLRIALAQTLTRAPMESVYEIFSHLADFVLDDVFLRSFGSQDCCVIGLGKLGGKELNFSSDVDLIFLTAKGIHPVAEIQQFVKFLQEGSSQDFLYRADLRLRPHGNHGSLFLDHDDYLYYYEKEADVWEYQTFVKARPVAGKKKLGAALLKDLEPLVYRKEWTVREIARIQEIKRRFEAMTHAKGEWEANVKMGFGGIRDVEFTVQILQLKNAWRIPSLREQNTIRALGEIQKSKLMEEKECQTLREGYFFLRAVENYLQLYENRREFNVPEETRKRRALARSLGFFDSGQETAETRFSSRLDDVRQKCRMIFERIFFSP